MLSSPSAARSSKKNQVRPIDDYKANMVNHFVLQTEGVTVHAIDHIVSMVSYWLKASQNPREAQIFVQNVGICWMRTSRFLCQMKRVRKMASWRCTTRVFKKLQSSNNRF